MGPTNLLTTVSTVDPIKVYFPVSEQEYLDYMRENPNAVKRAAQEGQLELELILADGSRYREKCPLPHAEEHLGRRYRQTLDEADRRAAAHAVLPFCKTMAPRFALIATLFALLASPGFAQQEPIQVATTTTDLRSLAEAVGGDGVVVVSSVPPRWTPGISAETAGRAAPQACALVGACGTRRPFMARSPAGTDRKT